MTPEDTCKLNTSVILSPSRPDPFLVLCKNFDPAVYPPGFRPRIQISPPCAHIVRYEYPLNGQWVMMDVDDGYVLWTGIWKGLSICLGAYQLVFFG